MEAKDTVIKIEDLTYAVLLRPDLPMGQAVAEEQAKVSFQAGQLSRTQEIVEWINLNVVFLDATDRTYDDWKLKVKEWLEEKK